MSGANAPAANALPQDQKNVEQRSHEPSMEEILASIRRIISDDQMLPLSPRASVPPLPPNSAAGASVVPPAAEDGEPEHPARSPGHVAARDPHDDEDGRKQGFLRRHGERDEHEAPRENDDVLDLADVAHDPVPAHEIHEPVSHEKEPAGPHAAAELAEPAMTAHEDPSAPSAEPTTAVPSAEEASQQPPSEGRPEPHHPIVSDNTVSAVSSSFHQLAATMLMQNFPPVDQIARELLRPMIKTWLDDNLPVMVERLVRAEIERVARVGR